MIFCPQVKDMRPSNTDHQVFIVRLSVEPQKDGIQTQWVLRGQVEHPRTGQAWRFVSLDDLPRILEVCLQGWLDEGHVPPATPQAAPIE